MERVNTTSLLLVLLALAACSSGGSDSNSSSTPPPPATSAEGLWNGTTVSGRTVAGLVLEDDTFWFLYSAIGNSNVVAGLVQGNGNSQNGSFTSSNARDFNLEGLGTLDSSMNGTYVMKETLSGTIAHQSGQATFTTTYDPDYEVPPDLNQIAGTFTGLVATNETVTVTVSGTGSIFGSSTSGCTFAGTASPRSRGNAFNVTVTFGGGVCINGTDTVGGVAYFDAPTKRLYSAALNSSRNNGFIFIGTKP